MAVVLFGDLKEMLHGRLNHGALPARSSQRV